MNTAINTAFNTTATFCTHAPGSTRTACNTDRPTSNAVPVARGFHPGSHVFVYSPNAIAAAAIGAEKPTNNEIHPAKKPADGCNVRDKKRYSPPDSGIRRANAP